ncbi:hypothetical protein FRC19_008670 [Serendipita sp. 401]|nr:hypothetical protein FRC19_008670 [Serendipita sp. 401]KAG9053467.1 hypothetical protein FS842_008136 [Serendipita sp. 407]
MPRPSPARDALSDRFVYCRESEGERALLLARSKSLQEIERDVHACWAIPDTVPITLFIRVDEPPLYPTGVVLEYVWDQIRASPTAGQTIFWERACQNPIPIARPPRLPPMQASVENAWSSTPHTKMQERDEPEVEDQMEESMIVEETETEEEDEEIQSVTSVPFVHRSCRTRVRRNSPESTTEEPFVESNNRSPPFTIVQPLDRELTGSLIQRGFSCAHCQRAGRECTLTSASNRIRRCEVCHLNKNILPCYFIMHSTDADISLDSGTTVRRDRAKRSSQTPLCAVLRSLRPHSRPVRLPKIAFGGNRSCQDLETLIERGESCLECQQKGKQCTVGFTYSSGRCENCRLQDKWSRTHPCTFAKQD